MCTSMNAASGPDMFLETFPCVLDGLPYIDAARVFQAIDGINNPAISHRVGECGLGEVEVFTLDTTYAPKTSILVIVVIVPSISELSIVPKLV